MPQLRLWARSAHRVRPFRASTSDTPEPAGQTPEDDDRTSAYRRAVRDVEPLGSVGVMLETDAALGGDFPVPIEVFGEAMVTVFVLNSDEKQTKGQAHPQEGRRAGDDPRWRVVRLPHPDTVHIALTAHGPFDVLVDRASRATQDKRRRLQLLCGHVRAGGSYVVDEPTADEIAGDDPAEEVGDSAGDTLVELVARLAILTIDPDTLPEATLADRALASSLESVELNRGLVALRRRGELSVKVRHNELERILRRRGGPRWARVRRKVPHAEVVSEAVGFHNDEALRASLYPPVLTVPRLLVRAYDNVAAHPGQVLLRDELLLPDSFRHWAMHRQNNTRLVDSSHYFAEAPEGMEPEQLLEGQYYFLDSEYPRHFGHLMTEVLGRLWAWPEAKRENPGLKVLMSSLLPYQAEILTAYGIDLDDVVTYDGPVRVESLISPMPAFHGARYVNPELVAETCERLRQGIPYVPSPGGEHVFLTRERGLWRECTNGPALEELFASRGFTVLRPELFSVAEQAALFREAKVVAGYLGSQLYGQVFSADPLDVIGFVGPSYTSNNEYLLATALGHTLHQFWCPEQPNGRDQDCTGRPITAMHRDYEFDFDRDLRDLDRLLDRLLDESAPLRRSDLT